jgi:chemotaxis protein MotB
MNRIIFFASLSVFLLFGTSCVTKRKFDRTELRKNKLMIDSASAHAELDELNAKKAALLAEYQAYQGSTEEEKAALLSQLGQRDTELQQLDGALKARAENLRQLQAKIDQQNQLVNKLQQTVSNALVAFDSDELTVEIKDGVVKVSLAENLLFAPGSAKMDPKGVEALGKLAVVLKNNPDVNISVVGHTDSIPIRTARYQDNWDLSVDRAVTITRLLSDKYGVDGKRLQATGRAAYFPIAENGSKEGRALNRRTDILLTPKLDELLQLISKDSNAPASAQ